MKNKIFTILLLGLLMLSFSSAITCWQTFEQGTEIELIQKCPSCTYVNITAITYPDGTIFMNEEMTNNGTNYNYTLPDSSQNGKITYTTIGDKFPGRVYQEDLCIEITPTGTEFTTAQGALYGFIFMLIGLFLFFSINGVRRASNTAWMIFYVCLTYIIVYAFMGVAYLITGDYLWMTPIIENILFIVWFIMGIGLLPFIFVTTLYLLGQEAKLALQQNYMKQGYTKEEARDLSKRNRR